MTDFIKFPRRNFVRYELTFITEPGLIHSITTERGIIAHGFFFVNVEEPADIPYTDFAGYNMETIRSIRRVAVNHQ